MKAGHVDRDAVKRVDLGKFIAELTEKVERDRERIRDLEAHAIEPVVIRTVPDDPLPALRYLEETREDFHARMRATLDSIRRR